MEKPDMSYQHIITPSIMTTITVIEDSFQLIISWTVYCGHISEIEVYFMTVISYMQNVSNRTKIGNIDDRSVAAC